MDGDRLFDLGGKVALVTGAGQNAGAGIAALLASRGATVLVNDVAADRAEAQAAAIRAGGGRAFAAPFDVTDLAAVRAGFADGAEVAGGPVDILVNNAGNGGALGPLEMKPFSQLPPEAWDVAIAVNLKGVMNCTHTALQAMIARGWGRIVTIASTAGTQGLNGGMAHYGAGKGGAIGFMRHIAMENAAHGITANSIALGLIKQGDDPVLQKSAARIPVGRRGNPADVAPLCLYLASAESAWFTGQTLAMNGGAFTS